AGVRLGLPTRAAGEPQTGPREGLEAVRRARTRASRRQGLDGPPRTNGPILFWRNTGDFTMAEPQITENLAIEGLASASEIFFEGYQGLTIRNGVVHINAFVNRLDPATSRTI